MKNRKREINWAAMVFLIFGSFLVLFPLYITINIALKSPQDMHLSVFQFSKILHFENFPNALVLTHFFRAFVNSFFITIFSVVLTILTNSIVAYSIARNMHRKLFRFFYYYFITAMFIPFPIIMLPIVKQTSAMGLANPAGLVILYVVYGLAFNVFLYVGYIRSLPKSLEEAAYIDGCSVWQGFWKVIFPLLAPINATVAILTTIWVWNDFMLPLVILDSVEKMTLPLVQYVFQQQFNTNFNLAFASYLMVMMPVIIMYIFCQKWIINGVVRGAVKE